LLFLGEKINKYIANDLGRQRHRNCRTICWWTVE